MVPPWAALGLFDSRGNHRVVELGRPHYHHVIRLERVPPTWRPLKRARFECCQNVESWEPLSVTSHICAHSENIGARPRVDR